jgi:hypothetical protein
MKHRVPALLIATGGALALVIVMLKLAAVLGAGQAPTTRTTTATTANSVAAPKTPWGEPDLQGIWTYEYQVPLQRPDKYAGKEFFTDAEIAELDKQRAAQESRDYRAPKGSEADVTGAYSAVFLTLKHTGRRTSLIVDPPDGKIPALTPEARKRADADRQFRLALLQPTGVCKNQEPGCAGGKYGPPSPRRAEVPPSYLTVAINRSDNPEDRSQGERCLMAILPDFGTAFGGSYRRIVQSPESVAIFYDVGQGQGFPRTIPITTSPHLPSHIRQRFGDARGRWEGNTLVVDITNFTPKTDFQGSRENLHLVERWTRTGPDTLDYVVTMDDPTTWTRPWTVRQELSRQSDQANRIYYEPRCHEGNYGLPGLLLGARTAEKAFAEGRGPDPATLCTAGCGFGPSEETADPLQ